LEFRKRIVEDFAIIFDGTSEEDTGTSEGQDFADKWGYFGIMYRLCNGDISKLEQITKLNLMECFTWLSYETDLESTKKVNINGNT
jgi:hypothetical protein